MLGDIVDCACGHSNYVENGETHICICGDFQVAFRICRCGHFIFHHCIICTNRDDDVGSNCRTVANMTMQIIEGDGPLKFSWCYCWCEFYNPLLEGDW